MANPFPSPYSRPSPTLLKGQQGTIARDELFYHFFLSGVMDENFKFLSQFFEIGRDFIDFRHYGEYAKSILFSIRLNAVLITFFVVVLFLASWMRSSDGYFLKAYKIISVLSLHAKGFTFFNLPFKEKNKYIVSACFLKNTYKLS